MKQFMALWILFAFVYSAHAIELTVVKGGPSCPNIHNSELCAQSLESTLLQADPPFIEITEEQISIETLGEEWRTVANENGMLFVVNMSEDQRFLYIFEQYYEGSTWHLVDRRSGNLLHTVGYPVFSPNQDLFVSVDQDLVAEYSPNVLSVYKIENGNLELQADLLDDQASWGPGHVEWVANDKFTFEKTWVDFESRKESPFISEKWVATRTKAGWATERLE